MATLRELVGKISFETDVSPLERVAKSIDGIKARLTLLMGIEGLRAIAALSERFGSFAIDLQNVSASAGLTTDAFQRLSYAASQSGISQQELGKVLGGLNKRLQDARMGSEGAAMAFAKANVTPEQVGNFKNAQDALFALGKGLNSIQDPVLRAAAAQETLGEAGVKLLASMNGGKDGLYALSQSAEAAANSVSDSLLENLAQSEKATRALSQQMTVFGAQLLGAVAPTITVVIKGLSGLLNNLRGLSAMPWKAFVYNFGYAMGFAKGVLEDVTELVVAVVSQLTAWGQESGLFQAIGSGFLALGQTALDAFGGLSDIIGFVMQKLADFTVWFQDLDPDMMKGLPDALEGMARTLAHFSIDGVIGALDTLYGIINNIWTVLGGSLDDTWIGNLLTRISGAGEMLHGKIDEIGAKAAPVVPKRKPESIVPYSATPMEQVNQMVMMQNAPTMAAIPNVGAAPTSGDTKMVTNAPVTINITGAADSAPVLKAVKEGIAEHHDKVLRQTQSHIPKAVLY